MTLRPLTIAISLKMYLRPAATLDWLRRLVAMARDHPAVTTGAVDLIALPSHPMLASAVTEVRGTPILIGAQNAHWERSGAYTGEVSPLDLRDLGVRVVELGHAERRRLFGETDRDVAAKVIAAVSCGLTPLICVGEPEQGDPVAAADITVRQLASCLEGARSAGVRSGVIVAYEPVWAIGRDDPATPDHIHAVTSAIEEWLDLEDDFRGSRVIYGGSAGPGILSLISASVDGLFLGRYAHDVQAVRAILDEALELPISR